MARRGNAATALPASPTGLGPARANTGLMALLRERRRLLEAVPPPRDFFSADALDVARDLEEEELWLAVSERRGEIQGQIEEAVQLLLEGRYGRCVDCRRAIPAARLRALPFAIRCLACQERLEKQLVPTRREIATGLGGTIERRGGIS